MLLNLLLPLQLLYMVCKSCRLYYTTQSPPLCSLVNSVAASCPSGSYCNLTSFCSGFAARQLRPNFIGLHLLPSGWLWVRLLDSFLWHFSPCLRFAVSTFPFPFSFLFALLFPHPVPVVCACLSVHCGAVVGDSRRKSFSALEQCNPFLGNAPCSRIGQAHRYTQRT